MIIAQNCISKLSGCVMNMNGFQSTLMVAGTANLGGFVFSAVTKSHKVTDLIGVGSFVLSTLFLAVRHDVLGHAMPSRVIVLNCLVMVWGVRLASYLFGRILQMGEDKRLHSFYEDAYFPLRLSFFWTLQTLWCVLTLLPVALANDAVSMPGPSSASASNALYLAFLCPHSGPLRIGVDLAALLLAVLSIAGEAVADHQKHTFKCEESTKDSFCDVGLWAWCRYPNYACEMLCWASLYCLAFPLLVQTKGIHTALGCALSPLGVIFLLCRVSGIPIHEANNRRKHGDDPRYVAYVRHTHLLLPWPPTWRRGTAAAKKSE